VTPEVDKLQGYVHKMAQSTTPEVVIVMFMNPAYPKERHKRTVRLLQYTKELFILDPEPLECLVPNKILQHLHENLVTMAAVLYLPSPRKSLHRETTTHKRRFSNVSNV
jgi:fructoselysine-6-P-deglycase FrlB-like protein